MLALIKLNCYLSQKLICNVGGHLTFLAAILYFRDGNHIYVKEDVKSYKYAKWHVCITKWSIFFSFPSTLLAWMFISLFWCDREEKRHVHRLRCCLLIAFRKGVQYTDYLQYTMTQHRSGHEQTHAYVRQTWFVGIAIEWQYSLSQMPTWQDTIQLDRMIAYIFAASNSCDTSPLVV